ncbi:LppU/SCO3897 family protein [Parafrankia sp. FMc2]|uniref:LppU/SCO3897 family protein n=1 Tax=Parafrankia sp. FMc2 TaxID=3233196 RepID=UPI0034D682CE
MRFLAERGPFCRTCGTALLRAMTARTLWQGWWGIGSLLITPVVLCLNLTSRSKIAKLPPPGPPWAPRPPEQRPLTRRPEVLGLLVPLAVVGVLIAAVAMSQPGAGQARSGDCVRRDGDDIAVVECASPDAQYVVLTRIDGRSDALCDLWARTTASYTQTGPGTDFVLCLGPVPGTRGEVPAGPGQDGPPGDDGGQPVGGVTRNASVTAGS